MGWYEPVLVLFVKGIEAQSGPPHPLRPATRERQRERESPAGFAGESEHEETTVIFETMKYVKPLNLFKDLMKTKPLERGRLLGLDVGDKYVGLAVSDTNNKIASPLSVLLRKKSNIELMASDFQILISELSLTGFIFGYPFDRRRSSPDAVQVKLLIDDLCKTGKLEGLCYTFWDECFTSKNVELLLKPLDLHPVMSKTIIDKFAAVGILQGYLDYVNRNLESESAG